MALVDVVEKFKNREVKAKEIFDLKEISKDVAYQFIREYHYLGDAKFFAMYCFGLYLKDSNVLVGVSTFSLPQGKDSTMGWFSLPSNDKSIVELSRLCMLPILNGTNATSYLLGNSIKMLKKYNVRAVITLADASRHIGSIYQVCNFTYYGLAKSMLDFYWGKTGKKPPRDESLKQSKMHGVSIPRTRKHRYAFILDKSLKCNYEEQPHPCTKGETIKSSCCDDTFVLWDKRYDEYYTCPKCTSKMLQITKEEYDDVMNKSSYMSYDDLKNYVEEIIRKHRRDANEMYMDELF